MAVRHRMVYSYDFRFGDLLPLMEFQGAAEQESSQGVFMSQPILKESLMKGEKEEAGVMAEAAGEIATKAEAKKAYVLTYYNPETQKVELLEARSDVRIKDFVTRMIEEAVGIRSAYPLYRYIGSPIMKQEIVLWKLEQILAEREYGTPPPSESGAPVMSVKMMERKKSEIVAIKKHEDEIREAIAEAIIRKEKSEVKIDEEILLLEETVEALRRGEAVEKALKLLPPLTRARYIVALRKRGLSREMIIGLLVRDSSFLKRIKKKLEAFTFEDLLNMVRMLRGLRKKSTS